MLPPQLVQSTFSINNNLNGLISLNKFATLHMVYDWEGDRIDFGANWNDQLFVATNQRGQSLAATANYGRKIADDLSAYAGVAYWRTFSSPLFGASELYSGTANLQYDVNPTMRLYGGYTYQHQAQLSVAGISITENVLYAAVTKRF